MQFQTFIDSIYECDLQYNAVSPFAVYDSHKRQYPNNSDCMTAIKDATRVISAVCVLSMLRVAKTRRRTLKIFRAQLNVRYVITTSLGTIRLVRHCEKHHGLNDQQYGSRKDRTAMDPVLLKQFS